MGGNVERIEMSMLEETEAFIGRKGCYCGTG